MKYAPRPGLAKVPVGYLSGIVRFFRDPDASLMGKVFVLLTAAYVVMPLDLIPDVAPVVGWMDDVGFAAMALAYLAKIVSRYREEDRAPVAAERRLTS